MSDLITVIDEITLDPAALAWDFVRASGPGGQNVNKVASAVQLRFDMERADLPDDVRSRLTALGGQRVTREGVLVIDARRFRTQARNRKDALDRLIALIRDAARPPKTRRPRKPPAETRRRRLEAKRRRGQLKSLRKKIADE